MTGRKRVRVEAQRPTAAVTTLELFFDLVFVFALTQVTDFMAEGPGSLDEIGPLALLRGALVLAVMWWCWVGYSWLGNMARADEGAVRVVVFAAMAAVFVAAIAIPEAFDDLAGGLSGPVVFAGCYFVVRLLHLLALYAVGDAQVRRTVVRWVPSMLIGTVLLVVASQTTGRLQIVLWIAAFVGDYLGTYLVGNGWTLRAPGHFAERHGLIIIVALGESIVATGIGIARLPVSWPIIAASVLALLLSAAMWWAYFDTSALLAERGLAGATGERQIALARNGYSFLHLPMVIGIIGMSLGLKKVLGYVAGNDEHVLSDPIYGLPLYALYGGVALYLLAQVAFVRLVGGVVKTVRIATAVLLLVLIPVAALLPALLTLALVAMITAAMIVVELRGNAEARYELRHAEH